MRDRGQVIAGTAPLRIYEVHLGSWRRGVDTWDRLAAELADHVATLGFTHVELMPIAEHPFGGSWGYQVSGYYAPTARFGDPDGVRRFVDALHRRGIGVIVDWVPAHFPRDAWSLGRFDGTALYEHPDPQRGEHPDWGTYVFDYGRNEVRNFLVANALYWLDEFHVDGLRVDAVASMLYLDYSREADQWTPNEYGGREHLEALAFVRELTTVVAEEFPEVLVIAEESTAWPGVTRPVDRGGLGFSHKWNLGWMHDTLEYLGFELVQRRRHHHEMTFAMLYAYDERFVLPLSHDEVVHGKGSLLSKMGGDDWQRFGALRALFAWQWALPGAPLVFMGSELARWDEWSAESGLPWDLLDHPAHRGVHDLMCHLNDLADAWPALWRRDPEPGPGRVRALGPRRCRRRRVYRQLRTRAEARLSGRAPVGRRVGRRARHRWRPMGGKRSPRRAGRDHRHRRAMAALYVVGRARCGPDVGGVAGRPLARLTGRVAVRASRPWWWSWSSALRRWSSVQPSWWLSAAAWSSALRPWWWSAVRWSRWSWWWRRGLAG